MNNKNIQETVNNNQGTVENTSGKLSKSYLDKTLEKYLTNFSDTFLNYTKLKNEYDNLKNTYNKLQKDFHDYKNNYHRRLITDGSEILGSIILTFFITAVLITSVNGCAVGESRTLSYPEETIVISVENSPYETEKDKSIYTISNNVMVTDKKGKYNVGDTIKFN